MLAGISADYYLRLERGRDRHPSIQVLEALARVLQLDDAHREHLQSLTADGTLHRRRAEVEEPAPGVLQLLGSLTQPAYIEGRSFDILASNPQARALSPQLVVGRNLLRDLFLDPAVQALHVQWEGNAECLVANLRQAMSPEVEDAGPVDLVEELSAGSDAFRQLWARHEVRGQSGGRIQLRHPEVGALTLDRERLSIEGAAGQSLVVFHAEDGSADADALALLLTTTRTLRPLLT